MTRPLQEEGGRRHPVADHHLLPEKHIIRAGGTPRTIRVPLSHVQRWHRRTTANGVGRHKNTRKLVRAVKQTEARRKLSDFIEDQEAAILAYLRRERPRRNRLTNISVWGSVLAAILTAGPAFGGTKFTSAAQGVFSLHESSIVWQILCLSAVILSGVAALTTNLANSHAVAAKVTAAETCKAQLGALQVALDLGYLEPEAAVKLLQQYVAQVPFIDTTAPRDRQASQ